MKTKLHKWETLAAVLLLVVAILTMTDANASDDSMYCFSDWSNGTECASYAITVADWIQTRQIRKLPGHYEKNDWICGKQPSEGCTAVWMLSKLGMIYYINHASPDSRFKIYGIPIRLVFNVAYTASHVKAVRNNLRLGIKLEF